MPSFWSYISNGEYSVGCTGRTVYVYDKKGDELARFRDLPYAYTPAFSPKGDIFVVKTTEGRMAVYSLEKLCLIKKFRFSKVDYSQDDNFCFSSDGEKLYNIERHKGSCKTALSIYNTADFSLEKQLFAGDNKMVLTVVEYDEGTDTVFLMGFFRDKISNRHFIARLCEDKLDDICYIPEVQYDFYHDYKYLEDSGFTKNAKEMVEDVLSENDYTMADLEREKHSLAQLWQNCIAENG